MDNEPVRAGHHTSRFADLVDRALEGAVVPSFTRIGYGVRSRLEHWAPTSRFDLTGRVVVITGATSGLGLSAARELAAAGATVEIIGRDAAKSAAVCARLRSEDPSADVGFSSPTSVTWMPSVASAPSWPSGTGRSTR